jgi:hypothetical protein
MDNDQASLDRRLSSMLSEAGLRGKQIATSSYDVTFTSDLREWSVNVRMSEAWVMLRTFVLSLPTAMPRRLALLENIAQANASLSLAKFSLTDDNSICIDLEYRSEHVGADTLKHLIGLVVRIGDEHYPKLFRIATGDAALDALESSFKKPATEPEPG